MSSPDAGYVARMLNVFQRVGAQGSPNFVGARINLPSKLMFSEWNVITHSDEDAQTVHFLRYGFPAGYKGPMQTHS